MRRIGFIDLRDGRAKTFSIAVFHSRAGKFGFEKTVEITPETSPAALGGIGEFYLNLPLDMLDFRTMKFPFPDKQKLMSVIPIELDGLILGGSESIVFDCIVLGKSGNDFEVLVAYIEKKVLKDILARLAPVGIDPQVVTSIELQHIPKRGNGDVASFLINPEVLSSEERMHSAEREISSPTLNLRRGPFSYTRDAEKVKRSFKATALLALLLAVVINADLALRLVTAKKEKGSIKKEMRDNYVRLFPTDKKISDELYQMKSHMKELRDKGEAMTGVSPLQLMTDLSQRTVQGVAFDDIRLDRESVTIKGEAISLERVDKVKVKLSEFLREPVVSDIKTSVEGKIRFIVIAKGKVS